MNEIRKNGFSASINDWIDGFEPWHTKDHRVHANGSNVEGLHLANAGDGEVEGNFAIRVSKNSTISKAYFDRGAGLSNKTQIGD